MAVLPMTADAAGLGKLTVMSALGQPLRAEIELTASREEFSSLSARMASADAFKNAGVEYAAALAGLRFTPVMRPNGQPFLLVTSDRPFNEPFVDMLVEANWAAGRLVREYTFLLDPTEVFSKPAVLAPVAVPEVQREASPPAPVPVREMAAPVAPPAMPEARVIAPPEEKPAPRPPLQASKPETKAVEKSAEGGTTRQVKNGDTLAKIANEVKPEGVNLDQMLVALFRSNRDVFDSGNMNRLRAGKILNIPGKDAALAVEEGEARKIVVAQAADFNAYRKKLAALAAAAPARDEAPQQAATGRIAPKVEDKVPPPAGKDKLEVSRTEATKDGKLGKRLAAAEEDIVARDKALKEANSRIAELEKNLSNLKKLAEMKNAAGAKAPPAAKPAEPAKPEPAPVLAVPAKPVEAAPVPVEKKLPAPLPPPAPPPSFIEQSPEIVFGGGGIVALLLGYLGFSAWRRKRQAAEEGSGVEPAADSLFASTGGQSIDTGAALPTDFSQDGAAGATSDQGVDPVAEAEVYMAYGRDSQAEEILLEALKTDPTRCAIHLKLLEIYAARKSVPQFGTVARELHGLTAGAGADWEKAATLGRSIDPSNPLYGAAEAEVAADDMASRTVIMQADQLQEAAETPPAAEEAVSSDDVPDALDFDLDLGIETPPQDEPASVVAAPAPAEDEVMSLDFDLDLGAPSPEEAPAAADVDMDVAIEAEASGLDFDLGTPDVAVAMPEPEAPAALPAEGEIDEMAALDFDFDLGATETPIDLPAVEVPAAEPESEPAPAMPALDLSAISLELDEPPAAETAMSDVPLDISFDLPEVSPVALEAPAEPQVDVPVAPAFEIPVEVPEEVPVEAVQIDDDPEVATKLELAHAYDEMGDKEGARELLNEVLNEGSPAQQEAARVKLAQLG